ncbi:MAG: transposase [Terriglobales bacterium]
MKNSPIWSGSACSRERSRSVLRRLIRYAEKIFDLGEVLGEVSDRRLRPRIPTAVLLQSVLALYWARLGSLNALETVRGASFWKRWLGQTLASADTVGRVHALLENQGLRRGLQHVYRRLKRNKALRGVGGWDMAILDGHESHASYRQHCSGCLQRTVHSEQGEKIQFYHRQVTLLLRCEKMHLLLDVEAQLPGENEVATALRLLQRVLRAYPRAFQLLLADAFYAKAPFLNFLISHGKQALLVLKEERRDLYQDVLGVLPLVAPQKGQYRSRDCLWWDVSDLTSWEKVSVPLRVVRSEETYQVRRQASKELSQEKSAWMWVTTLPAARASTARVVHLGHARWDIENYGFHELVNGWHADHIYKHDARAIEAFTLLAFLAYNLFHAFLARNIKPQLRRAKTDSFWAQLIAAQIYAEAGRRLTVRSP